MNEKEMSYEEGIERLELILKKLEDDNCTLQDSIDNFKEGISLYNHCNSLLNKAKGEVTLILKNEIDDAKETEFPLEERK